MPPRTSHRSTEEMKVDPQQVAEPYPTRPPQWRKQWHRTADLGYPDFQPPRPDQPEDEMSSSAVKQGYAYKPPPGVLDTTEAFSSHVNIQETLVKHGQQNLALLGDFMTEIMARRNALVLSIGPSTFKLPNKVTVHDSKREAWIADLANPDVPLSKLAKAVPHGFKGHDLLEMLFNKNVRIPRAIWYARVLGANETLAMRARPNFNPTHYSVEWANVLTSYLKKQLGEITLPMARPGLNVKQTFKGVLNDPETRERWTNRFSYSLAILRESFLEGLVDHATFLIWLSNQVAVCNLAQLGFVVKVVDEYIESLVENRGFLRPLMDGCLTKLLEIEASPVKEHLDTVSITLASIIQRSFLAHPDSFVSPRLWHAHSKTLRAFLVDSAPAAVPGLDSTSPRIQEILRDMRDYFEDVQWRNDALVFRRVSERTMVGIRRAMADVQLLNSVSLATDISTVRFFEAASQTDEYTFPNKLDVLLTWSIAPSQYGAHRPYVACTLLARWRTKEISRFRHKGNQLTSPDETLQQSLFEWLDMSDVARKHDETLKGVASLFGQLIHLGLFSYSRFVQKLMARGETRRGGATPRTHLMTVFHSIPVYTVTQAVLTERKAALYGIAGGDLHEEKLRMSIREELGAALPGLFEGDDLQLLRLPLHAALPKLLSASPFEQVYAIRHWLLPIAENHLQGLAESGEDWSPVELDTYSRLMQIMALAKCYNTMFELNVRLLRKSSAHQMVLGIISTLRRHADIWNAMNLAGEIADVLLDVFVSRKVRIRQVRSLVAEMDRADQIPSGTAEQFAEGMASFARNLQPTTKSIAPPATIPEVMTLIQDTSLDARKHLASNLSQRHYSYPNWALIAWTSIISSITQLGTIINMDPQALRECAQRFSTFLYAVDEHLASTSLDDIIRYWLSTVGKTHMPSYDTATWECLTHLIMHLAVSGTLKCTSILHGIVFPAWTLAASSTVPLPQESLPFVEAANILVTRFLLSEEVGENTPILPPCTLFDILSLQGHRSAIFSDANFPLLFHSLPLLASIEENPNLPAAVRVSSGELRVGICRNEQFKGVALRHVDSIRNAFVKPAGVAGESASGLEMRLLDALKFTVGGEARDGLSDPITYDLKTICSRFNPFGFSRAAIQLHLMLKQLSDGLSKDANTPAKLAAETNLETFAESFFGHELTAEETDLIAEVLKGVRGGVAAKFVNKGIQRLTHTMNSNLTSDISSSSARTFLQSAGEVLRFLVIVIQPLRDEPQGLPRLQADIQDAFVVAMKAKLDLLEKVIPVVHARHTPRKEQVKEAEKAGGEDGGSDKIGKEDADNVVSLLMRILQFDLGFSDVWTARFRKVGEGIIASVVRLLVMYGGAVATNGQLFPLILDTVAYLMDELPKDPKATSPNIDISRAISGVNPYELPHAMPEDYRARLRFILGYAGEEPYVANLVHASRNSTGTLTYGTRVLNRPWEWTEYVETQDGPLSSPSSGVAAPPKNITSISLEMFGAKFTGERVRVGSDGLGARARDELRWSEDRYHVENVYERDWREARVTGYNDIVSGEERANAQTVEGMEMDTPMSGAGEYDDDDDEDAVGSVIARTATDRMDEDSRTGNSTPATTGHTSISSSTRNRGSNLTANTTDREIVDVDSLLFDIPSGLPTQQDGGLATRGRKRKASDGATSLSGPPSAGPSHNPGLGQGGGLPPIHMVRNRGNSILTAAAGMATGSTRGAAGNSGSGTGVGRGKKR